jgi:hypothetical protein
MASDAEQNLNRLLTAIRILLAFNKLITSRYLYIKINHKKILEKLPSKKIWIVEGVEHKGIMVLQKILICLIKNLLIF